MKHLLLIIAVFIGNYIHAQDVVQNNLSKDMMLIAKEPVSGRTDANLKVMRSFRKSYPDVKNEKWEVNRRNHFVTFYDGPVKNRVVYRNNGQIDYSLRYYAEKELPSVIRGIVKSVYYDYAIYQVEELSIKNKVIYIVHVQDQNTFKTLKIFDADMEEIESFNKG